MNDKLIGILTFQNALNYGAVLQAYALSTYINTKFSPLSCEIIDYSNKMIDYSSSRPALLYSNNIIKKWLKHILYGNKIDQQIIEFNEFRKNYLPISLSKYNSDSLNAMYSQYPCVIVGSDQVWCLPLTGGDFTYFLQNSPKNLKKISYAASSGDLPPISEKDKWYNSLSPFEEISVRELSLKEWIVNNLNINCEQHLDPVFLLNKEEWFNITNRENNDTPYIFVYVVQNVKKMKNAINVAKKISAQTGYKIKFLSTNNRIFFDSKIQEIKSASPNSFISLINGAEYVITDSFHGTAFSILLHKNFYSSFNVERSSRIRDLLKLTKLEDRLICRNNESVSEYNGIDTNRWLLVDEIIEEERNRSYSFLLHSLKDLK